MAELRSGVKWLLFLSSYIPLYLILSVKHRSATVSIPETAIPIFQSISGVTLPWLSIIWLMVAGISGIILKLTLDVRKSKGGEDIKEVDELRSRDDLITNYILVYIFPFVILDYTNITNWLAFVLFFLTIGVIQVRSSQLYVNPVLAFFDYRVYEIHTEGEVLTVLSRSSMSDSTDNIRTVELSNNVHLLV